MSELETARAEAESLYEEGKLEDALWKYRGLLQERPEDADLLNDIGTVCFSLGLLPQSRQYYLQALTLQGDHQDALNNLKQLCTAQGVSWQHVLADRRSGPAGYQGSAGKLEDLFAAGRYQEAYALATQWTETEPQNPEAWNDAAVTAYQLGHRAEAVGYIQQALELAPDNETIREAADEILAPEPGPAPSSGSQVRRGASTATRVLFVEREGNTFLPDLMAALSEEPGYEVEYTVVSAGTRHIPLQWADVVWLEWGNAVTQQLTHQAAEALRQRRVVCRIHRFEVFTSVPHLINWEVVDEIVFVARHMEETFRRRFPQVEVPRRVINNGIDLDRFTVPQARRGARDIAFLAHINYRKNLPLMFQIAAALRDVGMERPIHVGGDWQDADLREYFDHMRRRMGLEEVLAHDGYVENVPVWLADKRFLLSTSISEGHPYNVLEGMASGMQPVIHAFPGADELFPRHCLYDTVAQAAELLSDEPGDPAQYRDYVRDRYPLDRQVQQVRGLLDELMSRPPRNGGAEGAHPAVNSLEGGNGLGRTYTEKWYRDRLRYREPYHEFARAAEEVFAPRSLVDLGCGHGYFVEYFADRIPVLGVEGSPAAFRVMSPPARRNSIQHDLTEPPVEAVGDYKFAVCIEVAEHIPQHKVSQFMRWFRGAERVLFTAAPPGQGGNDHCNEQPPDYWQRQFREIGFRFCPSETDAWRAVARAGTPSCRWVVHNAMFFRRED